MKSNDQRDASEAFILHELTPVQYSFPAVQVPETIDAQTATELADFLQEKLPHWDVSASISPDGAEAYGVQIDSRHEGQEECGADVKPGDWVIFKDDGAFAVVTSIDANVLFDMEEMEIAQK